MKKLDHKKVFFLNHCLPRESGSFAEKWHDTACNSGNTYIMHCINKMLFGRTLKHSEIDGVANFFDSILPEEDIDRINAEYEYVLINMQDQLRPEISYYTNTDARFKRINSFLEKVNIPILCFGVGTNFINCEAPPLAKQLHQSQIDYIKMLSDKGPGFSVRGEATAALMNELGIPNYSLTGCPTFLLNQKNIEKPKQIKKIVFCGGTAIDHDIKALNQKGVEVYFSCQDEREMVELSNSLRIPTSFGGSPKIQGMHVVYLTDFDEINEFYKDIDFTIGNRIHGCVMSLNAGTPAVNCNGDLRAKEMCRLWQMPRSNSARPTELINLHNTITRWESHDMQIAWATLKKKHDEFLEKILPD